MGRLAAVLGLFGLVMGASCGGVPKTYYYTLRLPPSPPGGDPKTTFSLAVERFRAAEILRDDRIIFYSSSTEVGFYQYRRWSADPATMLTEQIAQRLDEMGIFAHVRILPSRETVDYVLAGRLFDFEEVDSEAGVKGRVSLELALLRSRDHRVAWSFTRRAERAIEGKGIPGVVEAMNAATEDLLSQALPGLAEQVEHDFAESQQHRP